MANIYVFSGAGGANNGTSWADAYTTIDSTDVGVAAAGDNILIHKTHSETFTATKSLSWNNGTLANPVRLFCVDKDNSDALSTGAFIGHSTTGTFSLIGNILVDGVTFSNTVSNVFDLTSSSNQMQVFYNCTFVHSVGNTVSPMRLTSQRGYYIFKNCTIDLSGSTNAGVMISVTGNGSVMRMMGGTIKAYPSTQTSLFSTNGPGVLIILEGVDIQNQITTLITGNNGGGFIARDCILPTFTAHLNGSPTVPETAFVRFERCKTGTVTVPALGFTYEENLRGSIASSLSRYRTGGADDGFQANAHSWELISNANVVDNITYLETPPLIRFITSGSKTITVYVASGVTLQNDECWIEVQSPSEVTPNTVTRHRYQSTQCAHNAAPANLTTDGTSTWNGSGVGTKQKMSVSINPALAGPLIVRVFLAKPSTTIYVDPKLEVV